MEVNVKTKILIYLTILEIQFILLLNDILFIFSKNLVFAFSVIIFWKLFFSKIILS